MQIFFSGLRENFRLSAHKKGSVNRRKSVSRTEKHNWSILHSTKTTDTTLTLCDSSSLSPLPHQAESSAKPKFCHFGLSCRAIARKNQAENTPPIGTDDLTDLCPGATTLRRSRACRTCASAYKSILCSIACCQCCGEQDDECNASVLWSIGEDHRSVHQSQNAFWRQNC